MVKGHCIRMKKASFLFCILTVTAMFLTGSATAGGMRWPIGISYVSGLKILLTCTSITLRPRAIVLSIRQSGLLGFHSSLITCGMEVSGLEEGSDRS